MCIDDYDEFIKITCVFPGFINTRQDLESLLDGINPLIPRISPQKAANEIVSAILYNKSEIIFPTFYKVGVFFE